MVTVTILKSCNPFYFDMQTFEMVNPKGEKFLMRKRSNGDIITLKYLGKNGEEPEISTMCNVCNHSLILHQSKKKGGCYALKELHGYSATICGCKKCRYLALTNIPTTSLEIFEKSYPL